MGADPAEENLSLSKLKSEAVVHGYGTFPSIGSPDESFDPEGRVAGIVEKKREFYLEDVPDLFRQVAVVLPEPVAEFITDYFFNHSIPSSAVSNVGDTSPLLTSSSTSFSASCHSFVQYQP